MNGSKIDWFVNADSQRTATATVKINYKQTAIAGTVRASKSQSKSILRIKAKQYKQNRIKTNTRKMEAATNHRRGCSEKMLANTEMSSKMLANTNHNNNNIVQVHHPLKQSKSKHRHHHQQHQHQSQIARHDDIPNGAMCGNNCRYYYDSSSPTFPDLTPPRDMPTPHKSMGRTVPSHHQFDDDPDTIEFCMDEEAGMTMATGAKYYKDSNRMRHKTYDPQVRWSRNNIAVTMERFQPIASPSSPSESSSCTSHQDYSYAYYEPGAIMCHSNIPTPDEAAGPSALPPPNSMRALLMKSKERNQKAMSANRHTYQTRYGTHENIYEDVSDEVKHNRLASSAQSLNNDRGCTKNEFQQILNSHYRVLEELNLSVEELLMSSSPPQSAEPMLIKRVPTVQSCVVDTLGTQLTTLDLKDEHMKSPVSEFVIGEDSGFSGSSSGASYIGSLRNYKTAITRSLRRSSAPNCAPANTSAAAIVTNGTIYGSCRTAKYPPTTTLVHHPVQHTMRPMTNGQCYNGTTTVKLKHEKSPDASHKSTKFALWTRRSWGKSSMSLLAHQLGNDDECDWILWFLIFRWKK